MATPSLDLGQIVRRHEADFSDRYGAILGEHQRRALRDVGRCQTKALGGHLFACGDCGEARIVYNSCRNRHCPRCQGFRQAAWLEREAHSLLPVEYHHVVFTLPREVADLPSSNRPLLYELLFAAASETVREIAADPKHLGAQVGLLLVLHTWGQNLHYHPHLHGIVTGGGLSCDRRGQLEESPVWRSCRPGFFLPVRVLSRSYRGKYLAMLRGAYEQGKLHGFADRQGFDSWLSALYGKEWVVYSKPPFGGPEVVLKYLARYTHRVALSNRRLLSCQDGRVTFTYKDYADSSKVKKLTLDVEEFLRRWVQHVLPKGMVKIRHYGLLANRCREQKLALCRKLLWPQRVAPKVGPLVEAKPACCPGCGSENWHRLAKVFAEREGVTCGAIAGIDSS